MPRKEFEGIEEKALCQAVKHFISPVMPVLHCDQSIEDAYEVLKQFEALPLDDISSFRYFYVIDREGRLFGAISCEELAKKDRKTKISSVMKQEIFAVLENSTLREAFELAAERAVDDIPVIDQHRHLIGVFDGTSYKKIRQYSPKIKADIFQVMGLSKANAKLRTTLEEYYVRMPWLIGNIFSGLICALIFAHFQFVISKLLIIAMFIPLVLTMSESVAMQSMTLCLQHLTTLKVPWKRIQWRLRRDLATILLMGLTCALLTWVSNFIWHEEMQVMVAISISILLSMIVAACLGTGLPALLHAFKLDPKVAAGPVVLMIVDVLTTAIYLGTTSYWLR